MPQLQPWLGPLAKHEPGALKVDSLFVCPLQLTDEKMRLHPLVLSAAHAATAVELWKRASPDKTEALPPLFSFAVESVNSPLWPALLRLRPLRDHWERELRRSAVQNLLQVLPTAWLLDPAPIPPGAVIPGLGLPSWSELAALRDSRRVFILASVDGDASPVILDDSLPEAEWRQSLDAGLHAAAINPRILTELTPTPYGEKNILSFYSKTGSRVNWLGALALTNDGSRDQLHRIV